MSGQAGKWREEQVLVICPGSRTTMAQLGCGELTPPAYRIPTRMFRDEDTDEWRAYRTYKRKKAVPAQGEEEGAVAVKDGDEWEHVEDRDSDEGAVYPMEGGYITNMDAFLAFLEHVHGLLTTTHHNTPIMLMASPQWTRPDCEAVALYLFERTKTPALCMINSALATQYGLKWPHMTVVDIGFEKVDVTCIYDSRIVSHMDLGYPAEPGQDRAISGGEVFTQRLFELLQAKGKDFTYEMAEQLKKSNICEVLPYAPNQPRLMELPEEGSTAAAAAAAIEAPADTVADAAAATASEAAAPTATTPPPPPAAAAATATTDPAVAAADDDLDIPGVTDSDGVLDVATLVTSGQTKEFLAKKEKERSERGRFGRRAKDKDAEPPKPVRLPNAKRPWAMFHYEELVEDDDEAQQPPQPSQPDSNGNTTPADAKDQNGASHGNGKRSGDGGDGSEDVSDNSDMDEDDDEDGEGEGEGEEDKADVAKTDKKKDPLAGADPAEAEAKTGEQDKTPAAQPEDSAAAEKKSPKEATEKSGAAGAAEAAEAAAAAAAAAAAEDTAMQDAPAAEATAAEAAATPVEQAPAAAAVGAPDAAATANVQLGRRYKRVRRDFEIGLERFLFADRREIDRIVATIYRTVQGIEDMYMRPPCWENLVFVGNGCRLRGLRENILQTLHARHLISPSTATMFTSELPSHLGTPSGTGAQTPTPSTPTPLPLGGNSGSVNPLLQAATTAAATAAANAAAAAAAAAAANGDLSGPSSHRFHAQTPTSIRLAALPTYLSEWTKNGFEESMFLGAQVAARLAFCLHNLDAQGQESQRLMSLSRVEYNELGPKGIRTHSMLG